MEPPLGAFQIDTLLSLLRLAADGEIRAEQMRQRLGECRDFEPYETFDVLQAGWPHQKGALSSYSIHRWLQGQPCNLAGARLEDVAAMVMRYEGPQGELRYDNFLNMVLPKDPSHAWLKESILSRSSRSPWQQTRGDRHISPEVSYRLCQLFENEIDVHKRLNLQQMNLLELGALMPSICKFLDADQGICAGMGGLISPASLRRMLVDDLMAMSTTQCNALLRRINPSGSCLAPFHELAKVISLGQPWPLTNTLSSWPVQERILEKIKSPRRDGLSHSISVPPASPRRIAWSCDNLASPAMPKVFKTYDTVLSPRGSCDLSSTLTPSSLSPGSPLSSSLSRSWDISSPLKDFQTPQRASSPAWSRDISSPLKDFPPQRASSPPQRATPQRASSQPAGTKLFSSPSPARRGYAWDISSPAPSFSAEKNYRSPRSPRTDCKLARTSPLSIDRRASSPRTDCKLARTSPLSIDRRGSLKMVLNAIVQQAKLDVTVEQAKAFIPSDVSLESIFNSLDRFHKGYITDTDLWAFGQKFGGQTSFGHLCVLLHEIQLRRPRDFSSVTGRLSFRELGSFVVPVESIEQEVLNTATSDEEARTMLRKSGSEIPPLSMSMQYQLCRLMDTASIAAAEMEITRKQLGQCTLSGDVLCTLSAAFTHIADGRMSLPPMSLRRALIEHDIFASEQELSMLRNRYLKKGAIEVTFAEFTRQLTPRALTPSL